MKYKNYILILLITLFIGCNNVHAQDCYYQTADKQTSVKYTLNYKVTLDQRNSLNNDPVFKFLKSEDVVNKSTDTDKETNLEIKAVTVGFCPMYIVYRHKYDAYIFGIDSKGFYGFNNESDAKTFIEASNKINNMETWLLSRYNADGTQITEQQYEDNMQNVTSNLADAIGPNYNINGSGENISVDCNTLFGSKNDPNSIRYIANDILQYPRIIVPILVILYGMLDFAKAVVAGKEDEMKKAQRTFVMRVIAGVGFFFIPLLVDIIMELAEIVWRGLGYTSCDI